MQINNKILFEMYFNCIYYTAHNNFFIKINYNIIKQVLFFLKFHTNLLYTQLIDLSIIDYFEKKYRFELFYNLLSLKYNSRLILNFNLAEQDVIYSITQIFPNAN